MGVIMKKLLVMMLSMISLMSFASDPNFEQKFKQVNPQKSFSQKHYKKYKHYKKVMYKWLESAEKKQGNPSTKFIIAINKNLDFFQKYFSDYVKTEHNDHPTITSGVEMAIALKQLKEQEEQAIFDALEEEASTCMDEAIDPTCGDKNIVQDSTGWDSGRTPEVVEDSTSTPSDDTESSTSR